MRTCKVWLYTVDPAALDPTPDRERDDDPGGRGPDFGRRLPPVRGPAAGHRPVLGGPSSPSSRPGWTSSS